MSTPPALVELNTEQCFCGNHKNAGDAFCWFCWTRLSMAMRTKLSRLLKGHYSNDYEIFIHTAKAEIRANEIPNRSRA